MGGGAPQQTRQVWLVPLLVSAPGGWSPPGARLCLVDGEVPRSAGRLSTGAGIAQTHMSHGDALLVAHKATVSLEFPLAVALAEGILVDHVFG